MPSRLAALTRRATAVCACVLVASALASAPGTSAIAGVVRDSSGAVLRDGRRVQPGAHRESPNGRHRLEGPVQDPRFAGRRVYSDLVMSINQSVASTAKVASGLVASDSGSSTSANAAPRLDQ